MPKTYGFTPVIEKVRQLHKDIITGIFMEVVRPVLAKHRWHMRWCMGNVSFYTKGGKSISPLCSRKNETVVLRKLVEEIRAIYNDLPAFGVEEQDDRYALWWLMSGIQSSGRYSIERGFEQYDD